jgi:hypothetical protein
MAAVGASWDANEEKMDKEKVRKKTEKGMKEKKWHPLTCGFRWQLNFRVEILVIRFSGHICCY